MNKKLLISIAITIIYAIITLIGVLHHELWADEAQVWQLAKYLSIPELIEHLHNEGHPSLLYLLTMPFAKISSNAVFMQLICWFFMCLASFLLIYKAPFKAITKASILMSAGFFYFLPVIARGYSLIPFFVLMAAILYSKRKEQPILYAIPLFFLANTHAIMFGFVGILLICFAYEIIKEKSFNKNYFIGLGIITVGLILVILQLHNTTSSNICIAFDTENLVAKITKIMLFFFINLYNKMITTNQALSFPIIDIPCIFALIVSFFLLIINLYLNSKKLFIICAFGIGFQFAIYFFLYSPNSYVTRIFSALIILIFCYWILYKEDTFNETKKLSSKKFTTILLTLFFGLTIYNGINFYISEIKYDYAGAKETAKFIKTNLNQNAIYLIDNEPYLVSLAHYLGDDYRLHSIVRNKTLKYVVWDKVLDVKFSNEAWLQYCTMLAKVQKDIYVVRVFAEEKVSKLPPLENDAEHFELLYASKYTIEPNEGFKVYKFNP
ncbi:MAG: hypothetical protein IJY61_03915 [Candidatus Gastranaerophilales bacterium]|nr:hypothetical protein [Candidatus Gastranaerophilales bacterium]